MGWFRAYDGISTDAKYLLIAQRSGQPVERVVAVWMHVLDCANQRDSGERGSIDHLDPEAYAAFLQRPVEDIEAILVAMGATKRDGSPGMLEQGSVTAWRKRQPLREDDGAAERKRRQRDKEREAATERDDTNSRDVTPAHAMSRDVTNGHALQEETDKTEEKDSPHTPPHQPEPEEAAPVGAAAVAAKGGRAKPLGEPPGFAEFYAAYPRKVARPDAAKAYAKAIKRASRETIMAGLDRAKSRWLSRGTENDHKPHPASWLNSDRWADEDPGPLLAHPNPAQADPIAQRRAASVAKDIEAQRRKAAEDQAAAEGLVRFTGEHLARTVQIMREAMQ